jgi:DNA-binding NtrC family response regulator
MGTYKILIVEDDESIREAMKSALKIKGYDIDVAENGLAALEIFKQGLYDLIISDHKMPQMTGLELLEKIKTSDPEVLFIIVTAYGDIEMAVSAMKKGAYDFIPKSPNILQELELRVDQCLKHRELFRENKILKSELNRQTDFIGSGKNIEQIKSLIKTIAPSKSTVLVTGESGTGKELVARSIHFLSPRANKPFVKVNCAALPEGLIESELFGHEKGAFTGAITRRLGKFEIASGGTILLDEIAEMSTGVQAKLLRVLQEREINKVGGDSPIEVDIRIIATTNRDIEKEVKEGRFREDLFYRLNVFHISLPPLRERKHDIPKLVDYFIERYNKENGFTVEGVEDGCLEILNNYNWPGNIRELENAIERAVVLTRSGLINKECFLELNNRAFGGEKTLNLEPGMTIAEAEKKLIFKTLESCNNNRTKAAALLGISIRTLRNKLNEYGVSKE